jgi:hypothetical protein
MSGVRAMQWTSLPKIEACAQEIGQIDWRAAEFAENLLLK